MRVLILCGGADTGGQGIRIKTAFGRYRPDWDVRSVTASRNYLDYDEDVFWSTNQDDIARMYEHAEVIHVRNTFDAHRRFEKKRRPKKHKPVVIHHHGSMFRTDHRYLLRNARELRALSLVSTIDLLKYAPGELEWLPIPHDLSSLAGLRAAAQRDPNKIVIHHSPTDRKIKDTSLFEKVGDALMKKYPEVECRVVERMTLADNLRLKAEADIVYDQLKLGWGNNALEAWAMGIPVVGGIQDPEAKSIMHSIVGPELPLTEATSDTLFDVLEQLVLSRARRDSEGARGREYVERWHDEKFIVTRLVDIYSRAAGVA